MIIILIYLFEVKDQFNMCTLESLLFDSLFQAFLNHHEKSQSIYISETDRIPYNVKCVVCTTCSV